jgi:hypothetical protein
MGDAFLAEHFLQHFLYSQEPFAVIGGRLYTLGRTNLSDTEYSFRFLGKTYVLDESEEVSQLEKEMFTAKRTEIQEMMTQYIQTRFVEKVCSNKEAIRQMQNLYESVKDTSIERFIMIDVFNEYNHEKIEEVDDTRTEVSQWENLPEAGKIPGVEELASIKNSLDPLFKSSGLIVIDRKCYTLYEKGERKDEGRGYVQFGKRVLELIPWLPLEKLCQNYTACLADRINQKADEHGNDFAHILEQMEKEKQQLDEAIKNKQNGVSRRTEGKRGQIGFRKIKDGVYRITADIPPYIIEKKSRYYAFEAAILFITIKVENNRLMIDHVPKLEDNDYVHPLRWGGVGGICFGGFNWKAQRGIEFNYWYELADRKAAAEKIAETLRQGKKVLERGYVGEQVARYHNIDALNCKIADDRKTAEQYARAHGIQIERIIRND